MKYSGLFKPSTVKLLRSLFLSRLNTPVNLKQLWILVAANIILISCLGVVLVLISGEKAQLILSGSITACAAAVVAASGYIAWLAVSSTERNRTLVEGLNSLGFGVLLTNVDGEILFANELMNKAFGEIEGNFLSNFIQEHSLTENPGNFDFNSACQASQPQEFDIALTSNSYPTSMWHLSATPMSYSGESMMWLFQPMSLGQDLTPATIDFLKAFKNFQFVFEHAPMAIVLLDAHAGIVECNQFFRNEFAYTDGEPKEQLFLELLTEECRQEVAGSISKILVGESVAMPIEMAFKHQENKTISAFATRVSQELTGEAEAKGIILHFFDSTSQKNLHLHLVQSQKMQAMGQLAGGIAHDFNNLLTAMIGFCDLLLQRHSPGDQSFTDIMQIKQNANRAANLVRQLLAFSKQQTLQPQVLNVTDTLSELSMLLQRLVGVDVNLDIVFGREVGLIKVDKGQFEQVIINLVVNARDAMKSNGNLSIKTNKRVFSNLTQVNHETFSAGSYVEIKVTDTGCGIPFEHLSRIFDPFFSTKEMGQGTGLGLSTVYGIVKQTGGGILVDTEIGKGTEITVLLPAFKQTVDRESAIKEKKKKAIGDLTGSGIIMFVEDEDAVRLFGARALRDKGYRVLEARNGEEALSFINSKNLESRETLDLMITDVVMPGLDGPGLVKKVHELYPKLKVIYISGYAEDSFRQKVGKDENIDFLPKPFSLKALAAKVKEVMNRQQGYSGLDSDSEVRDGSSK